MKTDLDADVLRRLRERDAVFLEQVFRDVNPYLARICLANGVDRGEVQELIHQTWERFFSNLDKFEGRSQLRTFICGILFNKIREHRRLQRKFVPEDEALDLIENEFTPDGWWRTGPADPHTLAENRELSKFVEECLQGLTERQMTAFVLKEVEGEDSDSICRVLGVNVTHLRVLLFRAKEKLRKCLEGKVSTQGA